MKENLSLHDETRSECVLRHVKLLTRRTRISLEKFSELVVEAAQQRLPHDATDFKLDGDVFERMAANGQKIARWMNPEVSARPSVDAEDVLVLALPEPFRSDCERDLAMRRGRISLELPAGSVAGLTHAGDLLRECGEALQALSVPFADGVIDERDDPEALDRAERELMDVEGRVQMLLAMIRMARERQRTKGNVTPLRRVV